MSNLGPVQLVWVWSVTFNLHAWEDRDRAFTARLITAFIIRLLTAFTTRIPTALVQTWFWLVCIYAATLNKTRTFPVHPLYKTGRGFWFDFLYSCCNERRWTSLVAFWPVHIAPTMFPFPCLHACSISAWDGNDGKLVRVFKVCCCSSRALTCLMFV